MTQAATASTRDAVEAAHEILAIGGNAVDAAVAAALASCVADPCNTGIGGYGGYMVVAPQGGPAQCVRFGLWAPSSMSPEMLCERSFPETGPGTSAVPNVVAGLGRALATFGSRDWATLVAPALRLAERGVIANGTTRSAFEECRNHGFLKDCFVFDEPGEARLRFRQPRLAATLRQLAENGPAWFYQGPLGDLACAAWRRAGTEVAVEDWRDGAEVAEVVPATHFQVGRLTVASAPLGVSGSACLFAFLEAARRIASRRNLDEPVALAELAADMARVWRYRFATPTGNHFDDVSLSDWVDAALRYRPEGASLEAASGHTAHLNVADADGTLVALTFTQGPAWFGGRWALGDSGVVMNAGMRNFARVGPVRHRGRMFGVSNMSPTIVESGDGWRLAVGSPGSRRIPSNVALAIARLAWRALGLTAAVAGGRLHAEGPELATYEDVRLPSEIETALEAHFAAVRCEDWRDYYGPLTAIRLASGGAAEVGLDDRETPGFGSVRGSPVMPTTGTDRQE